MLKYSRAFVVLALTIFAFAVTGAMLSPSYSNCARDQEREQSHSQQSGTFRARIGIIVNCEAVFANDNGAAITGIATVLLTVVTGMLGFIAYMQFWAAKNQTRPYVYVQAKQIVEWAPDGPMKIRTFMENVGATPAFNVEWTGAASVEAVPLYREKKRFRKKQFMVHANAGIPHSKSPLFKEPFWSIDEVDAEEFSPEIIDFLYTGQLAVYIYSFVWHRDVFGARYTAEACHYIALDDMRAMIEQRRLGQTARGDHMQILHAQEFNHLT